jgi:hypothetical protein
MYGGMSPFWLSVSWTLAAIGARRLEQRGSDQKNGQSSYIIPASVFICGLLSCGISTKSLTPDWFSGV